jgi:hypothetical protein
MRAHYSIRQGVMMNYAQLAAQSRQQLNVFHPLCLSP